MSAVPGVVLAAANTSRGVENNAVTVSDSGRGVREIAAPNFRYVVVSPGYLRTLGLPVVRGRDFRDGERDEAAVIIDEYTAAALWPAGNPVGALIKFGDAKSSAPFVRIVGVAGLVTRRTGGLPSTTDMRLGTVYYLPGPRDSVIAGRRNGDITFFTARAAGNPSALSNLLRHAGARRVRALGEDLLREKQSRAFVAELFTLFAALGLALAAFGVYGVVAHSVAERRRELGVRIALGASSRDILHAVLRESVVIALAGIALGLLATKYGVPLLQAMAFEDDLYNAPLFAAAAAFLFVAAAASALIPALRATRVDPTESLRNE
jgi:putative ABC transport system permease protein